MQECERNKANRSTAETTIMENNIPVSQYYENKSGDTVNNIPMSQYYENKCGDTVIICEDNE